MLFFQADPFNNQLASISRDDIKELFLLCDVNNSGYIEKTELKTIIPNADCATLERLLTELDSDGDGRVSLQELEDGLHKLTSTFTVPSSQGDTPNSSDMSLERR